MAAALRMQGRGDFCTLGRGCGGGLVRAQGSGVLLLGLSSCCGFCCPGLLVFPQTEGCASLCNNNAIQDYGAHSTFECAMGKLLPCLACGGSGARREEQLNRHCIIL